MTEVEILQGRITGAIWTSWERKFAAPTDGKSNQCGPWIRADDPELQTYVAQGGRIEEPGTPDEELAWLKAHKIVEIEAYADDRLERNESNWSRSARLARIALVDVCPQAGPITLREIEQTHYDAETLAGAKNYIDHVQAMDSIDAVRAFAPEMMAWPKFT